MSLTVDMRVSPKVHQAVMRLARKNRTRAWKALESLIPPALLEHDSSSTLQPMRSSRADLTRNKKGLSNGESS
jgi:hypothetical protein